MVTPEAWAKAVFSVINKCSYPGYAFSVAVEGRLVVLRVVFTGPDVVDGSETQMGRPWVIEFGAHPPQIVQTAFKAVLTSLEHRARESFAYGGRAVMSPHRTPAQMLGYPTVGEPESSGVPEHQPASPTWPGGDTPC